MRLSDLHTGERAIIREHHSRKAFRKRLMEMGFITGEEILVVKNAPLQDPIEYRILNYDVTLRRCDAKNIEVEPIEPHQGNKREPANYNGSISSEHITEGLPPKDRTGRRIRVAFVGNPNCGKTSLFNATTGAHEHVGNYSGVTVEAKLGSYKQDGYTFELIDLPGAYSLSSYSEEERYISQYLLSDEAPDVLLNVIDVTNLERHLYLTTQLMETSIPMVVALNMWDELESSGSHLHLPELQELLGMPLCPTVGRTGKGIKELFRHIIDLYEHCSQERRIIDVNYPPKIEECINTLLHSSAFKEEDMKGRRPRFLAIKFLEEDQSVEQELPQLAASIQPLVQSLQSNYKSEMGRDLQQEITNCRYGFVRGALAETYHSDYSKITEKNRKIDHILTHKVWGFPIFIALMFLMFQLTFTLGAYPMEWIESGVAWLGSVVSELMTEGMLKDLIVDGVIAGVGGVLVFLPNIVILYLCLAIMEDTGYMARAAFIMDRIMHLIGLHGKSFIPLVMGFGCNVPAVMATRTIEHRGNRLMTMLIIPFMSCSAKLPVYLLLAGAFFPNSAGTVLFALYFSGITLACITALCFKKRLNSDEDTPFVMELPPYRIPTAISVLLHMWDRSKQYLQKMGTVILVASIAIWGLSYFPNVHQLEEKEQAELIAQHISDTQGSEQADFEALDTEHQLNMIQQEYSMIGRMGHAIQPIFKWHGYDWRMSVALLTGVAAKEIVVSTLGVLYAGDSDAEQILSQKLQTATNPDGSKVLSPLIAFSFMLFVLIYIPCISTVVAIGRESGSWKYALFSVVYSVTLAWILTLLLIQVGQLFIS